MMLLNCGVGEYSWESLGLQGDPNQSILKEISPGCSLVGLKLKLKLQYFGHLIQRTDSLEKALMLGKIEGRKRRGRQRMRWLDVSPTRWTWVWVDSRSWWWTGRPGMLQFMGSQRVRHNWATELNRTEMIFKLGFSAASELIISPWYLPCRHELLLFSHSVMSNSAIWWTAAHHIPLSFINCWSLLKLTSTESVMPSNRILCHPPLLLPSVFPSIRVFSNELALCIRWPNYWNFSFSISPYSEYSGLISFGIDWFDLVIHGTLKNLLQHHSLKASILQCSVFFMVQLSHPYMTAGKTTALLYRSLSAKWCLCFLTCCLSLSQLFFQGVSIDMRDTDKIHVNKLLFCFLLLICLSLQKSQARTQKDREKIIFLFIPSA